MKPIAGAELGGHFLWQIEILLSDQIPAATAILSVIAVIGCIGNMLVLNVYCRKLHDKQTATLFILVLAISDSLTCGILIPYTMAIEPHTNYMGPRAAEDFDISMRLSLVGIGASLAEVNDYTTIRELIPGGPAALSGQLNVGDRIVGVAQGERGEGIAEPEQPAAPVAQPMPAAPSAETAATCAAVSA